MGRAYFLCKDTTWINLVRGVGGMAFLFTNLIFAEVKIFDAFGGARGSPLNTCCVTIIGWVVVAPWGMPRSTSRSLIDETSLTHSLVARISAPRELSAV